MPQKESASPALEKNGRRKAEPKPKRGPGRPKDSGFHPTPEQRGAVEAMVGFGIPYDEIIKMISNPQTGENICKNTLLKHFRPELDRGRVSVKTKVMGALYNQAVNQGNVTAQIFFLKTQCGWREPDAEEDAPPPAENESQTALESARRIAFTLALGSNIAKKK